MKNLTIDLRAHFSYLISRTETRYVSYKKLLENLFKEKKMYENKDFEWLRTHFREMKNFEERILKSLVNEWTEIKQDNGI